MKSANVKKITNTLRWVECTHNLQCTRTVLQACKKNQEIINCCSCLGCFVMIIQFQYGMIENAETHAIPIWAPYYTTSYTTHIVGSDNEIILLVQ